MSSQVTNDMATRLSTCSSLFSDGLQECYVALQDDLTALTSTLHSMSNTNSFMLMSINRTIDFSKASNGIVLVPRPESFSLPDLFLFAMNCVRDLNPTANIQYDPIPDELTRSVVTEKQWLLDNLLCLASNAVKFSPTGNEVRVSLQLRRRRTLPVFHSQKNAHHPLLQEHRGHSFTLQSRNSEGSTVVSTHVGGATVSYVPTMHRLSSRLPAGAVVEKPLVLLHDNNKAASHDSISSGNFFSGNDHHFSSNNHANTGVSSGSAYSETDNELMIMVEVEDNGIGIADEATRRALFDGFQQTNRLAGGAVRVIAVNPF
jgi:signal transduction histidine kinase